MPNVALREVLSRDRRLSRRRGLREGARRARDMALAAGAGLLLFGLLDLLLRLLVQGILRLL